MIQKFTAHVLPDGRTIRLDAYPSDGGVYAILDLDRKQARSVAYMLLDTANRVSKQAGFPTAYYRGYGEVRICFGGDFSIDGDSSFNVSLRDACRLVEALGRVLGGFLEVAPAPANPTIPYPRAVMTPRGTVEIAMDEADVFDIEADEATVLIYRLGAALQTSFLDIDGGIEDERRSRGPGINRLSDARRRGHPSLPALRSAPRRREEGAGHRHQRGFLAHGREGRLHLLPPAPGRLP